MKSQRVINGRLTPATPRAYKEAVDALAMIERCALGQDGRLRRAPSLPPLAWICRRCRGAVDPAMPFTVEAKDVFHPGCHHLAFACPDRLEPAP